MNPVKLKYPTSENKIDNMATPTLTSHLDTPINATQQNTRQNSPAPSFSPLATITSNHTHSTTVKRHQLARNMSMNESGRLSRESGHEEEHWYKIHFFRGVINDLKRRAPFYWSDWTDAWDYRVVPATIYMYFAK